MTDTAPGIETIGPDGRQTHGPGYFDVTVRVPVPFESAAGMAGWLYGLVEMAMERQGWKGAPVVLFRLDPDGPMGMFQEGLDSPYTGGLPHGLVEPD